MLQRLKRLLQLLGSQKGKLLVAFCILSVIGTALWLVPFILTYLVIIKLFQPVVNEAYIWTLVICSIIAIFLRFIAMALSTSLAHIGAYNILYDLRIRLAEKLGKLPLGYFNHLNKMRLIKEKLRMITLQKVSVKLKA